MNYPQRVIGAGEKDAAIVRALRLQLNRMLALDAEPALRLDPEDTRFDAAVTRVVKLFQARNVDGEGRLLKQDGEVGALTWAALFGRDSVAAVTRPDDDLLAEVLRVAAAEEAKGVREKPKNSNRGPQVDGYLERAGVASGFAWCCAFVYWCFDEAAKARGRSNPMFRTAGCLVHWNKAAARGARRIAVSAAVDDPTLVKPGMVFVIDHGKGCGHTGFVERVSGGLLTTIEGNTDASKTREGGGVYRLTRKVTEINKGFLDYAGL